MIVAAWVGEVIGAPTDQPADPLLFEARVAVGVAELERFERARKARPW